MKLSEYQKVVSEGGVWGPMDRVKALAKLLRYVTRAALQEGYTLEELASLDQEEGD